MIAEDATPRLDQIRSGFVDSAWRTLFWVACIAVPVVLWRTHEFGWVPGFTIFQVVVIAVFVVRALQPRLPLVAKTWLMLLVLWLASVTGLSSFGIAAASISLLTTNGFIAAMVLPARQAVAVIAFGLLTLLVAAIGYVQGWLKPRVDLNQLAVLTSAWVNLLVVISGVSVMMTLAVGSFRRAVEGLLGEVARQRDEIEHLATHDKLTGLPSLRLATDRAEQALTLARRTGGRVALLFVDLDGFKAVNDGFGHEAGDCVLAEVAARLRACVRASDTAARIGGDEFMVVLAGLHDPADAAEVAAKIVSAVSQPVAFGTALLTVGASVGIATFPDHAQDTETLRRVADAAMYRVKRAGKNAYAFGEALA